MRIFIAINLNREMRDSLIDAQTRMYENGVRGNYTREENLHLTLAFIGEYSDPDAVMDALSGVGFTPFEIGIDGIGCFGDLWWAGIKEDPALTAVSRRIRRSLAESGIPFDRKRFSPHITLIRKASKKVSETGIEPASMTVDAVSIMRSDRGRNGMIYTEIGRIEAEL